MPLLEARGIRTIALDLPTCDPSRRGTTLFDDAETLAAALDALDAPAVIVGHSYGGMVITEGAAGHRNARHLVYLAAFMPDAGESLNSLASVPNPGVVGAIAGQPDGRIALNPEAIGRLLYNDCEDATVAWAAERVRSMSGGFGEAVTGVAWRERPSTYVVCTSDRMVLPELQRRMATRASNTIEFPTSHSPFASRPALLADAIAAIATA